VIGVTNQNSGRILVMSQMLDLLDDTTVTGLYGVRREISPTWTARVVDRDDLGDALQAVEQTCQT